MQLPYIKKHSGIGGLTVWIVDGSKIRKNLNKDFTNFGHHFKFEFIPRDELWIDRQAIPGEEDYFIENMLVQHKLMSEGADYLEALDTGGRAEQALRDRDPEIIELKELIKTDREAVLRRIRKKFLSSYSDSKISTYVVDGSIIRGLFFIDFTEGGHDLVYYFVPKNEVWIDDDITVAERKYIILHELHERAWMARGWEYPKAHSSASRIEHRSRDNPKEALRLIKEELTRQNIDSAPLKNPPAMVVGAGI